VEIFHYKNNQSKCICTNREKIKDFQYCMHIIWNEPFESDDLGKGGMTFWNMMKRVHGAKRAENHWSRALPLHQSIQ
jgi:hypothetical protein